MIIGNTYLLAYMLSFSLISKELKEGGRSVDHDLDAYRSVDLRGIALSFVVTDMSGKLHPALGDAPGEHSSLRSVVNSLQTV